MSIILNILLLIITGAIAGLVLNSSVLLFIAGMATLLYSACCGIDVLRVIQQLQGILGSRSLRRRSLDAPPVMLTGVGELLSPLVTGSLYQLSALEDGMLSSSLQQTSTSIGKVYKVSAFDDSLTLRQMLSNMALEFCSVGIGLAIGGRVASLKVESSGLSPARFVPALSQYLSDYYEKDCTKCFGLFDSLSVKRVERYFAAFGFRFFLCFPLLGRSENESAVVVVGFSDDSHPAACTVDRIRKRANEFYRDFVSSEAMRQLERRAEQAEFQERAASQFIVHMSHDIRSPLNNLKAVVSILEDSYTGEDTDLFLIARKNCDCLEEMVDGVLDFNKSAAGQLTARRQSIDLGRLATSVAKAFTLAGRQKDLQFDVAVTSGSCTIYADPHQLRRVISNLISNALKYTDAGSVIVHVGRAAESKVVFSIQDTGSGMSELQVASMFDAFQRFDESKQGVGLGLTVAKILCELNDGVISVESRIGAGTTVRISFPFSEVNFAPASMTEEPSPQSFQEEPIAAEQIQKPRVLVIDDDADSVFALQRSLGAYALDVCVATKVDDAVAICNFGSPEIVITDDHMPGGGGAEVVSFLNDHAATAHVLVLSGSPEKVIRGRYSRFSSVIFFQKPTEVADLVAAISEQLELDIPTKSNRAAA